MSKNVRETLEERKKTYGSFEGHAALSQAMKDVLHSGDRWFSLDDDMKESLEMIVHKIARILNGDPSHIDSWHDVIGYAKLIENRLSKNDS